MTIAKGKMEITCKSRIQKTRIGLEPCVRGLLDRAYHTVMHSHCRTMAWSLYHIVLLVTILVYPCSAHIWNTPGCHKVGHIREERIANCVVFNITLNVCRGFCLSFAVPSSSRTLRMNSNHPIMTSRAECCNIRETHDVKALVKCFEDTGEVVYRELIYKSAVSCSCSICNK